VIEISMTDSSDEEPPPLAGSGNEMDEDESYDIQLVDSEMPT
jgi:hypothetical protein